MRTLLARIILAGAGLALPLWALGQVAPMPVIPSLPPVAHAGKHAARTPVWHHAGTTLAVTAKGRATTPAPTGVAALVDGRSFATGAGVELTTKPGLTAHASLSEERWDSVLPSCAPGTLGCAGIAPADGVRRGEVGAGYAGHGVKLDLSLGRAYSDTQGAAVRTPEALLPRVLPAAGGADVAAPLWFRNSTATSLSARGEVRLAPGTSVDVGASVGRVHFLPGSGLAPDDTLDQTTLSFGIQRGSVRGAIVGHVLEPGLPGAGLGQDQRWSGIDLGISVRLPWRGELNFGAQNLWTSGHSSLLFGSGATAPDQGRVPYVQYHQDL
ncbi:MAG: hypothetical protein EPN38_09500 [Rhodanobacteraceae bacterium]|nr:MAG: hypothetical protein EPN38_09500 [Rhodanobacteraceae bacterium]